MSDEKQETQETQPTETPAPTQPNENTCGCGCGQRVPIARYTNTKRGHVKGQPLKFVNGAHARRRERENLIDRVYGNWKVIAAAETRGVGTKATRMWLCRCKCGTVSKVSTQDLKSGHSQSCGCLKIRKQTKHGHSTHTSKTKELRTYNNARSRCENPKFTEFERYGGSGVRFLFDSFEHFLAVLGPAPSKEHSLGRILDRGNYEPGNCFWMTKAEQTLAAMNNRALTKWEATRQEQFMQEAA